MKKLVSVSIAVVSLLGMMSAVQADVKTYRTACAACHAYGAPGPKVGDKAAWKDRIAKGMDALYTSALKGTAKGMPPKGGRMDLSDAEIKATVDYMVAESK
ncbi:MAG: c-type cytochrome [Gammaproteobacteria bacterium]|nr:c-type cytochrome [Gammaproteobacteria bacterium]MCW8988861.1 c-type cytochrome [Gammaproteobacteria bacterium]MCW9032266.1 c-type cytochrome [Gammaproteobacteria bacterium]